MCSAHAIDPLVDDRGVGGRGHAASYSAPLVDTGLISCRRCGQPITAGSDWDLGHRVERALSDNNIYPEYRWPTRDCPGNHKAGGSRTANTKRRLSADADTHEGGPDTPRRRHPASF